MPTSIDCSGEHTSTALIADARRRVPEAWQAVNQIYGPYVYAWCRESGIGEQDAVDIAQDVFRAVLRNIESFQHRSSDNDSNEGGSFRSWLWVITRNKVRDYWRTRLSAPQAVGGTDFQQQFLQVPNDDRDLPEDDDAANSEVTRQVLQLIQNEFEETTWSAFWLVTVEERSVYQVADDLGLSQGAVRQAKYRVLRRLREELGQFD